MAGLWSNIDGFFISFFRGHSNPSFSHNEKRDNVIETQGYLLWVLPNVVKCMFVLYDFLIFVL